MTMIKIVMSQPLFVFQTFNSEASIKSFIFNKPLNKEQLSYYAAEENGKLLIIARLTRLPDLHGLKGLHISILRSSGKNNVVEKPQRLPLSADFYHKVSSKKSADNSN